MGSLTKTRGYSGWSPTTGYAHGVLRNLVHTHTRTPPHTRPYAAARPYKAVLTPGDTCDFLVSPRPLPPARNTCQNTPAPCVVRRVLAHLSPEITCDFN
ncbi:hypothetical protein E2C01_090629 [Portunus trituberculatus]|uniref:Uncharacterized protein n=1 Tax=Portunus trituberculatus TaxID=210409 RepID=A0A5B7JKP1_PORTR|nr:hypothetical protein [Portunus trituberculatus]